jgi:hypothetical protein
LSLDGLPLFDAPTSVASVGPLKPGASYERHFWAWLAEQRWAFEWLVCAVNREKARGFRLTFRFFWEDLRAKLVRGELPTPPNWSQDDKLAPFVPLLMERLDPSLRGYFRHKGKAPKSKVDVRAIASGEGAVP